MIRLSLTLFISSTNLFYGLLFANSIVLYLTECKNNAPHADFVNFAGFSANMDGVRKGRGTYTLRGLQ